MFAEDFCCTIAFHAFRSRIPTDHSPGGIQHEYCVVVYSFYQQAKAFFAFLQGCFDALAIRDVTDRGQEEGFAVHWQRTQNNVNRKFCAVLAPAVEFQAHTHGANERLIGIALSLSDVRGSKALWNDYFYG